MVLKSKTLFTTLTFVECGKVVAGLRGEEEGEGKERAEGVKEREGKGD